MEGVAYGLGDSLELLRELGVDATAGRVSGGGTRSELWVRILFGTCSTSIRAGAKRMKPGISVFVLSIPPFDPWR